MTKITVNKKQFNSFLNTFGKDLRDIKLQATEGKLIGTVGFVTHYLRRSMIATVETAGPLIISDLKKVRELINAGKQDVVSLNQPKPTSMLFVTCDKVKMSLPTSTYIHSAASTHLIEKVINNSIKSKWTTWADQKLDCFAHINADDIKPITKMGKVLGIANNADMGCKVKFDTADSEMTIYAGKPSKAQMFVQIPLKFVDGPKTQVSSSFGKWLPKVTGSLPDGVLHYRMGEDTVMVIQQEDTDLLLIVFDEMSG